ncbi:vegetative cell wall protein gp1-like [Iris pallida]|uniref:Vegetative cell wall protein gp1-like n=1 Tax=Iris pallida TaxID=29817 RepID=A0AAX6FI75_IRIPA|nr:vegetative cell wall protein gp1-like [Iris pallida]
MRWHGDNFKVDGACATPEWLHPRPWLKQGTGSEKPRCCGELGRRSREDDTRLGTTPGMGRGSSAERLSSSSEKAAVASLGSGDRRAGSIGKEWIPAAGSVLRQGPALLWRRSHMRRGWGADSSALQISRSPVRRDSARGDRSSTRTWQRGGLVRFFLILLLLLLLRLLPSFLCLVWDGGVSDTRMYCRRIVSY